MFIRDSRRSYITYSYPELILIANLCLFETPVGVTELILNYVVHTCSEILVGITEITERILVLQSLFLSYTELILIRKYL